MKQGKGFTLVELLAVIVILAIILIIAVPGVLSIIAQTKTKAYDRQMDMIIKAAKNYVTAESSTLTWNGTDEKTTIITLDTLQLSGYLDKKILDPRDNTEITCADTTVTKKQSNKMKYTITNCTADKNKDTWRIADKNIGTSETTPHLSTNMIPIYYGKRTDLKTWFNYSNQQWANVAIVKEDKQDLYQNRSQGTEVKMDDIVDMFVWIPRFKYKLFNVDGTTALDGNPFLAGDKQIEVVFESKATPKSLGTANGEYLTHPAFTFGGQELDGFWVGKFETSYKGAATDAEAEKNEPDASKIEIKPNQYAWRTISVSNVYQVSRNLVTQTIGFKPSNDPHSMKNMEWAAMAYLTNSQYGKTGNPNYSKEERKTKLNNNKDGITGCGADTQNAPAVSTCNTYETPNGQAASTTGNITGIYDTSGGLFEYVLYGMYDQAGTNGIVSYSGFEQDALNSLFQENKYLESISYAANTTVYSRSPLGSAIKEIGTQQWHQETIDYIAGHAPWMRRGGYYESETSGGIMNASVNLGDAWKTNGFRVVVL